MVAAISLFLPFNSEQYGTKTTRQPFKGWQYNAPYRTSTIKPRSTSGRCLLTFGKGCQPVEAKVSCTTQHFPHQGTQPSLRLPHIRSSNQSCSQVVPGAKGQQTGRQQELETQTAAVGTEMFAKDELCESSCRSLEQTEEIVLLQTDSLS